MKRKYFLLLTCFMLTSCKFSPDIYNAYDNSFAKFEISNIKKDIEQYTCHNYPYRDNSSSYVNNDSMYDYTITIDEKRIPVSIWSADYYYGYTLNDISMFDLRYPSNSNIIKDDKYYYFDGKNIYCFDNNFKLENMNELDLKDEYSTCSALTKKDGIYTLFSRHNEIVIVATMDENLNILTEKTTNMTYMGSNDSIWTKSSYENEINAFYDEKMNEFIMDGMAYKFDSVTGLMATDSYTVLSQPTLMNDKYVYKAIKITKDSIYYDPEHSVGNESEKLQTYNNVLDSSKYKFSTRMYIHENGDVDVFLEIGKMHALILKSSYYSWVDYIKITDDKFKQHFFDEYSFYAGYVLKDGVYYQEVVYGNKFWCYNKLDNVKYYHFPV